MPMQSKHRRVGPPLGALLVSGLGLGLGLAMIARYVPARMSGFMMGA